MESRTNLLIRFFYFYAMELYHKIISTPIGNLLLQSDLLALKSVSFTLDCTISEETTPEILETAATQLSEYFEGKRQEFDLRLSPGGTEFQKKVWLLVQQVRFGETKSYGELALLLGSSKFSRAVGSANGSNPIPVIIPCHRIIGNSGKLTGYSGGLERKKWLLLHEITCSKNLLF
jgi:methylated-DNA-[protein]-cysteine S-methyltransferase